MRVCPTISKYHVLLSYIEILKGKKYYLVFVINAAKLSSQLFLDIDHLNTKALIGKYEVLSEENLQMDFQGLLLI